MEPIIRAVFETTVGVSANEVDIICNSVKVNDNGKFEILFRHPERLVADTSASPDTQLIILPTLLVATDTINLKPSYHTEAFLTSQSYSSSGMAFRTYPQLSTRISCSRRTRQTGRTTLRLIGELSGASVVRGV